VSNLTRIVGAVKLAAKAHAPTIMVVSGVTSMGASVILASKKTLQIEERLAPHVESLEKIQHGLDLGLNGYNDKAAAKDRGIVYGRVAVDMTKLYAVPGVLFVGGACLVFGGHRIMLKRNATLALAFTGLKKSFDAYRQRVRDEFGPMVDQGMLTGHRQIEVIDDDGKVQTVNTRDWDADQTDPYNRLFAEGETTQWINDLAVNKLFIQNQQRMAQILLGNRGYLYLSEVYEALGFPETDISRVVGWKAGFNPDGSKEIPVIDFGLDRPLPDDWKHSKEKAIYLDFNCQGLIIGGKVQKALEKA
jgi:hypothetical protein